MHRRATSVTRYAEQNQEILFRLSIQSFSSLYWGAKGTDEGKKEGEGERETEHTTFDVLFTASRSAPLSWLQTDQTIVNRKRKKWGARGAASANRSRLLEENKFYFHYDNCLRSSGFDMKIKSRSLQRLPWSVNLDDEQCASIRKGEERNATSGRCGAKTFQCRSNWLAAFSLSYGWVVVSMSKSSNPSNFGVKNVGDGCARGLSI